MAGSTGTSSAIAAGLSRDKSLGASQDNSEKNSRNAPPVLPMPQERDTISLRFQALICLVRENLQRVLPGRSLASLCRLRRWSSGEATKSLLSLSLPCRPWVARQGASHTLPQQSLSFPPRVLFFPPIAELVSLYSVRWWPSPRSTLRIQKQNKKKHNYVTIKFCASPHPPAPTKRQAVLAQRLALQMLVERTPCAQLK